MTNNLTTTSQARLPVSMTRVAMSYGMKILATLDRLDLVHHNQDGRVFTLRLAEAAVLCEDGEPAVLVYGLDTERMYHLKTTDVMNRGVIASLQSVCKKPVWMTNRQGLKINVELKPEQEQSRLPARADLDLGQRPAKGELLVPIGVSRIGQVWKSLPEIGHALIAGTTGSGKSTWLHSALAALAIGASPDKLRIVLVDPKRSELTPWAGIPHQLGKVAYDVDDTTQALADLVAEVDRRGDMMAGAGARDIAGYNRQIGQSQGGQPQGLPLPYILCIIDECLDLALVAGSRSELANYLKTISIRGRSAGVFLWAATQHAAAVTGLPRVVNVNLTTRLVFRVLDGPASCAAGCPGAQDIPRNRPGRMLAKVDDRPVEMQGFVLRDGVLKAIIQTVSGRKVAAPGSALAEREAALVRYAVNQLKGAFTISKLHKAGLDWSRGEIEALAQRWERKGWLTTQAHAAAPRYVTPELAKLASIG